MYWLIQDGFDYDPKVRELLKNLERMEVNHSLCKAIPFSEDGLITDVDLDSIIEPIFTYGSYTLSKIVRRRGYRPGSFISPQIGLDHLLENYGDLMLNSDMKFLQLGEVLDNVGNGEFFIRPMEDTKSFLAEVTTKDKIAEYIEGVASLGEEEYSPVKLSTMACVCKPKRIQQEIRFFVVNNKISTYSTYKIGDRVCYNGLVDPYIIEFVSGLIGFDKWAPDIAFCIDIALSEGELKIIEVNSINSSGLYDIDVQKFIDSINQLDRMY